MSTKVSQNGFPVRTSSQVTPLSWITGRVDPQFHDLFDRFCKRFDKEVEKIIPSHSWGWADRAIRGSTEISNHASGTAIDLNAPEHPLGKSGTFTKAQVKAINNILKDFPELRWGGNYSGRKDEMHFEIRKGVNMASKMVSPAAGRVTSEYGFRKAIPGVAPAMKHAGIDIANSTGTAIHAAYAGTVVKAGTNIVAGRSGKGVLIQNPDGERQYYGHLSAILVSVGQKVKAGQQIGRMGATGNVTGPHLHFETWNRNGTTRNPRVDFNHWGVTPGSAPKGVSKPKPKPKPKPSKPAKGKEWPSVALVVDGKFQKLSKKAYQRLLAPASVGNYKGKIDGSFASLSIKAEQRWLKRLGFYKGLVDGKRGSMTKKALQRMLKSRGFYKGLIDGKLQSMSVKALQNYLNSQRKYY